MNNKKNSKESGINIRICLICKHYIPATNGKLPVCKLGYPVFKPTDDFKSCKGYEPSEELEEEW